MAVGVDLQSLDWSLAVIPIKVSHVVLFSWGTGYDRESIGNLKAWDDGGVDDSQCLAWGCKRALEGFEFLFKVISQAFVLVFPAQAHSKLHTKIQERGAGGEELSFLSLH